MVAALGDKLTAQPLAPLVVLGLVVVRLVPPVSTTTPISLILSFFLLKAYSPVNRTGSTPGLLTRSKLTQVEYNTKHTRKTESLQEIDGRCVLLYSLQNVKQKII